MRNSIFPIQSQLSIASVNEVKKIKINKIAVSSTIGKKIISIHHILFIKADSNYAELVNIQGQRFLLTKPLKFVENILPKHLFFRCHQSYLVNIDYIDEIRKEAMVRMKYEDTQVDIPVARRQLSSLKNLFLCL